MPRAETPKDERTSPRGWSGRTRGGYVGNSIFVALIRYIGPWCAYLLLVPVSFYYLFSAPKAVSASRDYLRRIDGGGGSWLATLCLIFKHFFSFGKSLIDRIAVTEGNPQGFEFLFHGEDHIRQALAEGKGVVIISAHCGNWQAAATLLGRLEVAVNMVAYEGEAAPLRRFSPLTSGKAQVALISLEDPLAAGIQIMSALRRGEIVAMHADRALEASLTIQAPFLGAAASFPVGPFAVAAVSGAPLIHAFAMRISDYHYRFYAYPAEHLSFSRKHLERQEQMRSWVGLFAARLEETLRQYPLQWYNFYNFWEGSGPGSA
jgi:predicted LPLAT superfamily acyltransferase